MNLDNLSPKKFIFGLWSGTLVINQKNLQFWISICDLIFSISHWLETCDFSMAMDLENFCDFFSTISYYTFGLLYRVKLHVLCGVPRDLEQKKNNFGFQFVI